MKKCILLLALALFTVMTMGGCIFPGDHDHHDYDHHDDDHHDYEHHDDYHHD